MGRRKRYVIRCSSNHSHRNLNRHRSKCETMTQNGPCMSSLECQCPVCFVWIPRYKTSSHPCIRRSRMKGKNNQNKKQNTNPQYPYPVPIQFPPNFQIHQQQQQQPRRNEPPPPSHIEQIGSTLFQNVVQPLFNPPEEITNLFPVYRDVDVSPYIPPILKPKSNQKKLLPSITEFLNRPVSFRHLSDIRLPNPMNLGRQVPPAPPPEQKRLINRDHENKMRMLAQQRQRFLSQERDRQIHLQIERQRQINKERQKQMLMERRRQQQQQMNGMQRN